MKTAGREQIGASVFIEQKGPNWRIVDGAGLVCVVRGRSVALEMATRCQRRLDDKPAPVPVISPAKPEGYPMGTEESKAKYQIRETKVDGRNIRQQPSQR